MKTLSYISGLVLALLLAGVGVPAAEARPEEDLAQSVRRLELQLEEQTRRLDRLYRIIGPNLEELEKTAAREEQQRAADQALALERVRDLKDKSLTCYGSASPAAAEFAVVIAGGGARVFDAAGQPVKEFHQPGQILMCLAYSPDGKQLLAGTKAGALLAWDRDKGDCLVLLTNAGMPVERVTWLGKDRVAWGGRVEYWKDGKPVNLDKPAGAVLRRTDGSILWTFRGHVMQRYFSLSGSRDGRRLVVQEIPEQPRGAFLLDGATGAVLRTCYDQEHGSGPLSVEISPDGKLLAVGYAPYDVILWDAETGGYGKLLEGHSNWVVSLGFSADGTRLISGGGDSTARVWDVSSGKEIGRLRFEGSSTYVWSVGLSPQGDLAFALTEDDQLVVARVPATRK